MTWGVWVATQRRTEADTHTDENDNNRPRNRSPQRESRR